VIRSMTGFGRGESLFAAGAVIVELRAVNGRHLDVRLRLPRELGSSLEPPVRAAVAACFARGQIEVQIRLSGEAGLEPAVEVSEAAVRRYLEAAERLRGELSLPGELSVVDLLRLPGVAQLREPEIEPEALGGAVLAAVEAACAAALQMREREGRELARELAERLEELEKSLAAIEGRAEEVKQGLQQRLERRIASLSGDHAHDPARLAQEVLYYVDRSDVTEETVRLRSHLAQFRETLELGGPVGRKLEFLLQEMGREVNTVGSKAQDAPVSSLVVELKAVLEKIREQVLNVE
jgi:uncharacterized protein (TIGR00255 family)